MSRDLPALVQAYLDDALTDREAALLRDLLQSDEGNLDTFIRMADLHGFLAGLRMEQLPTAASPSHAARRSPGHRRAKLRRSAPARLLGWMGAMAACAFVALVLLATYTAEPAGSGAKEMDRPKPLIVALSKDAPSSELPAEAEEALDRLREAAALEREAERLRTQPLGPGEKAEARQEALRANEEDRRKIESEPREPAIARPRPREADARKPAPPSAAVTESASPVAPLVVERVRGEVYFGPSRRRLPVGMSVAADVDIVTGDVGCALLRFPDGTWVELGSRSLFREETSAVGRRLFLAYGSLVSEIARQPEERPCRFSTPHAVATILGTKVRLTASKDFKIGTCLEVGEGRVRLARTSDGKSVDVPAGQFAMAAEGVEIESHRSCPEQVVVNFGPEDSQLPPGQLNDSGAEFDPARGYGWLGPQVGPPIATWVDGLGQRVTQHAGRIAMRRADDKKLGPLRSTEVSAGWSGHLETWKMPVPNGRYAVSVCCGSAAYEQGPHHVNIEGLQVIDRVMSKPGFIELGGVVEVRDGDLTMKLGGHTGAKPSRDGTSDTTINYLIIKRVSDREE